MNMNGQFSQVYPGQAAMVGGGNALMPMYPLYHFHHHSQTMGLPAAAHIYSPTSAAVGSIPTVPALISKPTPMMAPTTGTYFDTNNYSNTSNWYIRSLSQRFTYFWLTITKLLTSSSNQFTNWENVIWICSSASCLANTHMVIDGLFFLDCEECQL